MVREETRGAWYRDRRLTAFDGTTFTVPGSEENDDEFGRPGSGRGEKRAAYPQVQAACLIELGTHAVFDGADLLWRVNANLTLPPVEHFPDGAHLAEVIPPHKCGITSFRLRVVEYKLRDVPDGKDELYRLVTTITDPARAPAKELAVLYHERWDIEGFFKQIKTVQLNDAKIFRSKSPDGIRQEFWAHLAVHYATTSIMTDAAHHANLDPDRISHKNTVRIIRSRVWIPGSFSPLPSR